MTVIKAEEKTSSLIVFQRIPGSDSGIGKGYRIVTNIVASVSYSRALYQSVVYWMVVSEGYKEREVWHGYTGVD